MFGMSVNDVPGWLVAIAPRGIGVPVAATPGLVPHCDVLTVELPDVLVALGVLPLPLPLPLVVLLLLLHPAAASNPITATRPTTARTPEMCFRMLTYPPPPGVEGTNDPISYLCEAMNLFIALTTLSCSEPEVDG